MAPEKRYLIYDVKGLFDPEFLIQMDAQLKANKKKADLKAGQILKVFFRNSRRALLLQV